MRIPPYWELGTHKTTDRRGRTEVFEAWGWSFKSRKDAVQKGSERAQRIAEKREQGEERDEYDYLDLPLREEIIDSLGEPSEEVYIITRNRYGVLVLNCSSVCFVDIDAPYPKPKGFFNALRNVFSTSFRDAVAAEGKEIVTDEVKRWAEANPARSFRLYETAAGLRLVFTDRHYDPTSQDVADLFQELGSDTLYRRLTEKQESFRARLTPKPWRCNAERPLLAYPRQHDKDEENHQKWVARYEKKADAYAVCRLVDTFGSPTSDPIIDSVIQLHDSYCCSGSEKPLA